MIKTSFEGLEKMRFDLKISPEKTIINDFAEMFCIAKKIRTSEEVLIFLLINSR